MLSLHGGGLSTREIQSQLEELYGVDVSPTLISNVTDAVLDQVKTWRSRPLDAVFPIVYFGALVVKSRQDGSVKNRTVYLALGINLEGEKVLLGLWCSENHILDRQRQVIVGEPQTNRPNSTNAKCLNKRDNDAKQITLPI